MYQGDNINEQYEHLGFKSLIGYSSVFLDTIGLAKKAAGTSTTVMILGESGTGKELLAKAIHYNSQRANKPLIEVNCAAFPDHLLESELFGYEKGAFTGAEKTKPGRFELADSGTLFLDEIGDMSLPLQAKLLRALQEREFMRLGGTKKIRVDVRFITATNKDLKDLLSKGFFRHDLYYRVNVYPIIMPSLRDRREDIPLLLQYFLAKYTQRFNKKIKGISHSAMHYLRHYDWVGNIRELQNALERAVILCKYEVIMPEDLPTHIVGQAIATPSTRSPYFTIPAEGVKLDDVEKDLILQALERVQYNKTKAAELLGLSRSCLRYRLLKHKIKKAIG